MQEDFKKIQEKVVAFISKGIAAEKMEIGFQDEAMGLGAVARLWAKRGLSSHWAIAIGIRLYFWRCLFRQRWSPRTGSSNNAERRCMQKLLDEITKEVAPGNQAAFEALIEQLGIKQKTSFTKEH